jgi:murein L,D-transpeptidase YafK
MDCPDSLPSLREYAQVAVVWKAERKMGLYERGELVENGGSARCLAVALGDAPVGDKGRQGDERTPVGTFRITHKNPHSAFHVSLGLNYPDAAHAQRGFAAGTISADVRDRIVAADRKRGMPPRDTAMGGDIYLHGGGSSPDTWTNGCVAVSNADMDVLYAWAKPGTAVVIVEQASGRSGEP